MDNAFLSAVTAELEEKLTGLPLGDVVQIDSRRFALRFSIPPFPRLMIDLHPEIAALHLVPRAPTPREVTELGQVLTEALGGRTLAAVRKEPLERVVELDFSAEEGTAGTLVVELMGRASNLLLLDASRRIVRFLRAHKGSYRTPVEGEPYLAPPPRDPAGSGLPWASRLLGREASALAGRGRDPGAAAAGLESRMSAASWEPILYTPGPAEEIEERTDLPASACFPSPFPLECAEGLHARGFASPSEAAAAWADLARRHMAYVELRGSLGRLLGAEAGRFRRLLESLRAEREAALGAAGIRRSAELILASLGTARKQGDRVVLRDIFEPEAPEITLRVDPKLDLKANAEALFRRARKMERAAPLLESRLHDTEAKLARVETFLGRLETARDRESLERLEGEMDRSSAVRVVRRPERSEAGRKPSFMRIREYRTSDGFTIVAGRSGKDNDVVTFKMAAPHDFWLHAAGRPGAHVIVRNPRRAKELPEAALREAAALAAWFSRGDRETDVEVHYTKRKEVRKGKGMSPGMVLLRSWKSIKVRPGLPPGATED